MAYNPYDGASNILNLKGQWETADEEERKKIENRAKAHYKNLIDNGYGEVANQLQNSNYQQAQGIVKGIGKSGKTAGRKYMADILTGKYGMTQAQANNAITWDEHSGDVSLGDVNVGKGDVLIDGTNYYSDTAKLDNAIKKYADNNGLKMSEDLMYNQGMQGLQDKSNQVWDMAIGEHDRFAQNIYDSPEGKAALAYYTDLAEKAGLNELAAGAGANSGNISSYSQANAARKLSAMRNNATMEAIAANQAAKQDILGYYDMLDRNLGRISNNNQQIFDNQETRRLNDSTIETNHMNNLKTQSEITGRVPLELEYGNNPYLNSDGSLKDKYENFDFKAAINKAVERGDERAASQLRVARGAKMQQNWEKYGQYDDGDWYSVVPGQSEAGRQFDEANKTTLYGYDTERYASDNAAKVAMNQTASAERIQEGKNATDITTTQIAANSNEKIADKELEAVTHDNAIKEQQEWKKAMNEKLGRSADNMNASFEADRYGKEEGVPVIMKGTDGSCFFNPALDRGSWLDPVISAILHDTSLDENEKDAFFAELNINDDDVSRVKGYLGI